MDVFASVVSTKHSYCRYTALVCWAISHLSLSRMSESLPPSLPLSSLSTGVLQHSVLPQIWRPPSFPSELHEFLLSLLERFEITFPVHSNTHKLGKLISLVAVLQHTALFPSVLRPTLLTCRCCQRSSQDGLHWCCDVTGALSPAGGGASRVSPILAKHHTYAPIISPKPIGPSLIERTRCWREPLWQGLPV